MSAITELAKVFVRTSDARMVHEITDLSAIGIFKAMDYKMRDLGISWTEVRAEADRLRAEPKTAPDVTFRRSGATSPTTPLQGSAKGRTHG